MIFHCVVANTDMPFSVALDNNNIDGKQIQIQLKNQAENVKTEIVNEQHVLSLEMYNKSSLEKQLAESDAAIIAMKNEIGELSNKILANSEMLSRQC